MPYDYPVEHRPDLLERLKYMQSEDSEQEMKPTPTSKEFVGQARRETKAWENFTSGNAYILYVENRTSPHSFRVQVYGETAIDAVKRWYRGLSKTETWIRHCVRVVAVYACPNTQTSESGELLIGTQQHT